MRNYAIYLQVLRLLSKVYYKWKVKNYLIRVYFNTMKLTWYVLAMSFWLIFFQDYKDRKEENMEFWWIGMIFKNDVLAAYYTEWNKFEREEQISYTNAYIWNLERWYWWIYWQGSNGDKDNRKQICGHRVGRRWWDEWREEHGNINTTVCKTDRGNLLYDAGSSNGCSVTA